MSFVSRGLLIALLLANAALSAHITLDHFDQQRCAQAIRFAQFAEFGPHSGSNVGSYFLAVRRGAKLRWSAEIVGRWPGRARVNLRVELPDGSASAHAWIVTLANRHTQPDSATTRELCRRIEAWSRESGPEARLRPIPRRRMPIPQRPS